MFVPGNGKQPFRSLSSVRKDGADEHAPAPLSPLSRQVCPPGHGPDSSSSSSPTSAPSQTSASTPSSWQDKPTHSFSGISKLPPGAPLKRPLSSSGDEDAERNDVEARRAPIFCRDFEFHATAQDPQQARDVSNFFGALLSWDLGSYLARLGQVQAGQNLVSSLEGELGFEARDGASANNGTNGTSDSAPHLEQASPEISCKFVCPRISSLSPQMKRRIGRRLLLACYLRCQHPKPKRSGFFA